MASAPSAVSRGIAAFVLATLMALGCVVLWVGIPMGWFAVARRITDDATTFYVIALLGVPVTMAAWGLVLGRINRVYLRLRGADQPTLFHALLVGSVLLALLAFLIWSVVLSGQPSGTPWPDEFSGPGN